MEIFKAYWSAYFDKIFKDLPYALTHLDETWEKLLSSGIVLYLGGIIFILVMLSLFVLFWNTFIGGERGYWKEEIGIFSGVKSYRFIRTDTDPLIEAIDFGQIFGFTLKVILVIVAIAPIFTDIFWLYINFKFDNFWSPLWRSLLYTVMRLAVCALIAVMMMFAGVMLFSVIFSAVGGIVRKIGHNIKTFFTLRSVRHKIKIYKSKKNRLSNAYEKSNNVLRRLKYDRKITALTSELDRLSEEYGEMIDNPKAAYKKATFSNKFSECMKVIVDYNVTIIFMIVLIIPVLIIVYFAPITMLMI